MLKIKKREIEKALKEVKLLEKHIIPEKEIIKKYKEGIERLEKLKELLEPSWFIKDEHETERVKKKQTKSKKKYHKGKNKRSKKKL